ncbi:MAG TPA: NAD-dependent epimerase/dehydratase family protein [Phycisphaerae bacterium]|nr:NAD-dependent epimerase/dehydratase family protein [Phycisphaerae bacterium]
MFITGGAGFVGSHLADRLLGRGDKVLVIDNYPTARRDNLTPQENLSIVDADLVNRTFEHFAPEVVVHAASSDMVPR